MFAQSDLLFCRPALLVLWQGAGCLKSCVAVASEHVVDPHTVAFQLLPAVWPPCVHCAPEQRDLSSSGNSLDLVKLLAVSIPGACTIQDACPKHREVPWLPTLLRRFA